MSVVTALYLVLLAAVAGYVLIARVPSLLHTPMMSGSNFIHGIVLAGAMLALANAGSTLETIIGFLAVVAASANVVGGFIVTDRMLNLFDKKGSRGAEPMLRAAIEPPVDDTVEARSGARAASSDRTVDARKANKDNH